MRKNIFPFIGCVVCLIFVSYIGLRASEDILDDENQPIQTTQADFPFAMSKNFDWIYSTVILTVFFDDGSLRQGFALLLKNGFYLTSSELTYHSGLYPKKIFAKMQDDSAKPLICIAQLQLKAMDTDKGLALLKTSAFTDDYCNIRSESYYHKRIYDKYSQNISSTTPTKKLILGGLYFPTLEDSNTFGVNRTASIKEADFYDNHSREKVFYGYSLPANVSKDIDFGKPYFNRQGEFLGIYSKVVQIHNPILIKKEIIQDFICGLKKKNIVTKNPLANSCKAKGV
ncbi:hypothetical protein [Helicobacter sp. 13S00477-4]|uniref:hypothetical protein n=1 Tax=Helicobacter sp. 13S00477-4 TaxID=1905759 RepID=UPI000BA6DAFB|nr:hypothetical protein [Helicobacter sp. 13S00477-4]PAF50495.1 hypothetical protein BKH44_08040 [Helicobacter sp. 13S00477-4]